MSKTSEKNQEPKKSSFDQVFSHDFDGIQEYDNPLPGWWKQIFYVSILFSGVYFYFYHIDGSGLSEHQIHAQEVKEAAIEKAKLRSADAEKKVLATLEQKKADPAFLAAGKALYQGRCAVCHGAEGQGFIGPNLTDGFWIFGPKKMDIYRVIRDGGREGKGMLAWGSQLSALELEQATIYVASLHGTKPPNPKAPEPDAKKFE